jgi:hypothetical protein
MSPKSTPESASRIVQVLLLAVGALLIAYAISDHPLYGGEPGFGQFQMLITATGVGLALCGLLPASIAGRILLLTVSSLVMLAFAEIAGEIVLGPRHRPIFQPDDRLIFKFLPSRHSVMTRSPLNGGETVSHHINSEGFRGDELRPAGAATRVVVYGDSFIHAIYSAQEETFAARLGALIAGRLGREVEVVNAGVSSYGPDQISLKMEDELPRLRPDLVVVAIFAGNDYGDLMRNKMFRLGADGALVDNRWKLDPKVRLQFTLSQQESILKRALRSALASRRAPQDRAKGVGAVRQDPDVTSWDFLREEAEREYRNFVVERDDVVTNTHADYYSADISLTPASASARYKIALMRAVLRRIHDVAAQGGIPLAFLFIPHPFDVSDDYDGWRVDRARFPEYDGRNQIAPLEDMARALSVPFVSLYDVYRANGANSLYFRGGDDHWNAAGQRMAAQVMADYLLARGLPRAGRKAADGVERQRTTR